VAAAPQALGVGDRRRVQPAPARKAHRNVEFLRQPHRWPVDLAVRAGPGHLAEHARGLVAGQLAHARQQQHRIGAQPHRRRRPPTPARRRTDQRRRVDHQFEPVVAGDHEFVHRHAAVAAHHAACAPAAAPLSQASAATPLRAQAQHQQAVHQARLQSSSVWLPSKAMWLSERPSSGSCTTTRVATGSSASVANHSQAPPCGWRWAAGPGCPPARRCRADLAEEAAAAVGHGVVGQLHRPAPAQRGGLHRLRAAAPRPASVRSRPAAAPGLRCAGAAGPGAGIFDLALQVQLAAGRQVEVGHHPLHRRRGQPARPFAPAPGERGPAVEQADIRRAAWRSCTCVLPGLQQTGQALAERGAQAGVESLLPGDRRLSMPSRSSRTRSGRSRRRRARRRQLEAERRPALQHQQPLPRRVGPERQAQRTQRHALVAQRRSWDFEQGDLGPASRRAAAGRHHVPARRPPPARPPRAAGSCQSVRPWACSQRAAGCRPRPQ
jgi:hypothetical protein